MVVNTPRPDPPFHGYNGLNDVEFDTEPETGLLRKEHACEALKKLITAHQDQVTLVALGPLTNLAMAFKLDENLSRQLKELVIMGGNTESIGNVEKCAEFNFHWDPEAAFVVLDLVQCPTFVVGWEACFKYSPIELVRMP